MVQKIWDDTVQAGKDLINEFKKKIGPAELTEKERAALQKKLEEKPIAASGRRKQGAGGGQAIIE